MLNTAVKLESVGILESSRSKLHFCLTPSGLGQDPLVLPSEGQLGIWAQEHVTEAPVGFVSSLLMALPVLFGKSNYTSDVIPSEACITPVA